MTRL
jgi:ABC-type multidrug transport system fused ATPase/permease subunit